MKVCLTKETHKIKQTDGYSETAQEKDNSAIFFWYRIEPQEH